MARPIVPATSRHWPHNNNDTRLAEEEIGFTRLRERCDVMANRSDREQGQLTECPSRFAIDVVSAERAMVTAGFASEIDGNAEHVKSL